MREYRSELIWRLLEEREVNKGGIAAAARAGERTRAMRALKVKVSHTAKLFMRLGRASGRAARSLVKFAEQAKRCNL